MFTRRVSCPAAGAAAKNFVFLDTRARIIIILYYIIMSKRLNPATSEYIL